MKKLDKIVLILIMIGVILMAIYGIKENKELEQINKIQVSNITLDGNNGVKLYLQFKRYGSVINIRVHMEIPYGVQADEGVINISDLIPDFAKTNETMFENTFILCINQTDKNGKVFLSKQPNEIYNFGYSGTNSGNEEAHQFSNMTYITDDEIIKENNYVLGDINDDGLIDETDLQMVKDYYMSKIILTKKQFLSADINGDGQVSGGDYVKLKNQINGTT